LKNPQAIGSEALVAEVRKTDKCIALSLFHIFVPVVIGEEVWRMEFTGIFPSYYQLGSTVGCSYV